MTHFLRNILSLALLLCTFVLYTHGSSQCSGHENTKPFIYDAPKFVKETKNGKKYIVGNEDQFSHVVHVYGTPYEMGFAYGTLLKDEIVQTTVEYTAYLEDMIYEYVKFLPKKIAEMIIQFGLDVALDVTWEMTRLYTPSHFIDEIKGIADASGVDEKVIRRFNLLPELIKAQCTVIGAYGDATLNITDTSARGGLFHLRGLDWDSKAVIKRNPVITVYHPNKGNKFVNAAWPAFIGTLTGVSEAMIGIGEKVWLNDRNLDTRFGKPWTYVLRDVIQFSNTLDEALNELKVTNRTCSIHLGIGDSKSNEFRGVEYSYKELNIYDWQNQYESEGHPRLKQVVYWDKHKQPSNNPCLGSLLQENYGKLDGETIVRKVAAVHETGDMQCAVFDYSKRKLYIANASPKDSDPDMEAYKRSFLVIDLQKLFDEKQ